MSTAIKPLKYPNSGTATYIEVTILNFKSDARKCDTYWQLLDADKEPIKGAEGNYSLTEEEFNNWGSDNFFVVQCVVNSLPDVELV